MAPETGFLTESLGQGEVFSEKTRFLWLGAKVL